MELYPEHPDVTKERTRPYRPGPLTSSSLHPVTFM